MRLQWTLGAALLLAMLAAGGQSLAAAKDSGHLAALAARQDLCDMVCFAMADGHMSQAHRALILQEAKSVLSPAEYLTFKRTLDRIAPPPKPRVKGKHMVKAAPKKKPTPTTTPVPVHGGPELVIPASANQPDGMAPPEFLR
ncbi:MAG: hypothetical protein WCB27_19700 [Thermoguttaceae bacterium]|jgi:hypothetical protein